jgi:hypothetical protein
VWQVNPKTPLGRLLPALQHRKAPVRTGYPPIRTGSRNRHDRKCEFYPTPGVGSELSMLSPQVAKVAAFHESHAF